MAISWQAVLERLRGERQADGKSPLAPPPPVPGPPGLMGGPPDADAAYRLHALQQEWGFMLEDPAFRSLDQRTRELEDRIEREGEAHRKCLYEEDLLTMSPEECQILPVWISLVKALHQAAHAMEG